MHKDTSVQKVCQSLFIAAYIIYDTIVLYSSTFNVQLIPDITVNYYGSDF